MSVKEAITTRPAKAGETGILYDLICELGEYEGNKVTWSLDQLTEFAPFYQTEFALMEDTIVGYALYFYGFMAHLGYPNLHLHDLYVKSEFRRRGVGTRLWKQLEQYGREKGCCRLTWHVYQWNKTAIKFYESLGAEARDKLLYMNLEIMQKNPD